MFEWLGPQLFGLLFCVAGLSGRRLEIPVRCEGLGTTGYSGSEFTSNGGRLKELYSECGVSPDVMIIYNLLESNPRDKIKQYAALTDRTYSAAKRDWSRKVKIARQLSEAKSETLVPLSPS